MLIVGERCLFAGRPSRGCRHPCCKAFVLGVHHRFTATHNKDPCNSPRALSVCCWLCYGRRRRTNQTDWSV